MKKALYAALLFLAACVDETTHDVEYYTTHNQERIAKLAECKNTPGEKAITANCINADRAAWKLQLNSKEMAHF